MRALALFTVLAGLMAACGSSSGGAFPEEVECALPAPIPTSPRSGAVSGQAYTARARTTASTVEQLRTALRAKYSEDTFYRREAFRPDFASYADQTICAAEGFLQFSAPSPEYEKYDADLDRALTELVEHTRFGREAVRSRNVSEYRDWFRQVDAKISAVRTAAGAQR